MADASPKTRRRCRQRARRKRERQKLIRDCIQSDSVMNSESNHGVIKVSFGWRKCRTRNAEGRKNNRGREKKARQ